MGAGVLVLRGLLFDLFRDPVGRLGEAPGRGVGGGHHEQGEERGHQHAGEDHHSDGDPAFRARPGGEHQGQRADGGGHPGHHDGAQAHGGGLQRGLAQFHALIAQLVGELHDQDAVLRRQADQDDQADLGVYVQAGSGHVQAEQTAGHGQRHGEHDHHRLDQAFELGGQHQEHD